MDTTESLFVQRPATANRPLLGVTALVVEDSRFASEAIRLLCQRSGARIRRADSLANAQRHLKVYRPSVIIVDLGLPDGSGLDLIRGLSQATQRVDVILGTSGDDDAHRSVLEAGADGFLAKPVASLAVFQDAILRHLPRERQPPGPRLLSDEVVAPDMIAYRDDLNHVATVLEDEKAHDRLDYVTQFLSGVANSAADTDMRAAVGKLQACKETGSPVTDELATLSDLVETRLSRDGLP